MQQYPHYTRDRIAQACNRFSRRVYRAQVDISDLKVAGPVDRISFDQAQKLDYKPAVLGMPLEPLWSTWWFNAKVDVPDDWAGGRVDLVWSTNSEATIWMAGQPVQGQSGSREVELVKNTKAGQTLEFQIEVACNTLMGAAGAKGQVRSKFFLETAKIGQFDPLAWRIYHDMLILRQLEAEQIDPGAPTPFGASKQATIGDLDKPWAGRLLAGLNEFLNTIDEDDPQTWEKGLPILDDLLAQTNGSYTHELSAIGHAHIDTAWLWPLAETHRKCVRSFTTACRYMDDYPQYKFACSQAYQYDYIEREHPSVFARIAERVKRGQWVPVGGTWVEPDCNMPSGEALCRQFLFGQRYFKKKFGRYCNEFWNPDVFGYNGQLPQIISQAGIKRFLTQKLSWNRDNKPMHHTFTWVGIDGSEVLAHFPPANTYNAVCTVEEVRRHARNYKDNDRSKHAMYLFGYGDGGGGPTRGMIEALTRMKNLQGVPKCNIESSDTFFDKLESDLTDRPRVHGELYFELHRGTYTSQAATKLGNRKSEWLLHDIEMLAAFASKLGEHAYPKAKIDELWKTVLLNQFHDILPGSSITLVYEDTAKQYQQVREDGQRLRDSALGALARAVNGNSERPTPINTLALERNEVVADDQGKLVAVSCPPMGFGQVVDCTDTASIEKQGDTFVLENRQLRAVVHKSGRIDSITHKASGREAIGDGGVDLSIYDDKPTVWEAWDIDPSALETRQDCPPASEAMIVTQDPLRVELAFKRSVGKASHLTQTLRLDADSGQLELHFDVNWHESRKLLKLRMDTTVRALHATYEMQYGVVERPNHESDSIAMSRYEVPAHRFADLSEHGFGVALLSECKYGFAALESVLEASLLRAPFAPDPNCDRGKHRFAYAIVPHEGDWRNGLVAAGLRFNNPIRWSQIGPEQPMSFASCDNSNVVLDTVKQAEDGKGLVLRLYEAHGGSCTARIRLATPIKSAHVCNILEEDGDKLKVVDGQIEVKITPYKMISVHVR